MLKEQVIDPEASIASLRDFLDECAGSAACEETARVREGGQLLRAMQPTRERFDSDLVEGMLACGATESAVLAILGRNASFMVSRGAGGPCLATVVTNDGAEERSAEGTTFALALLAAYVSLLLARFERSAAETTRKRTTVPSARLH